MLLQSLSLYGGERAWKPEEWTSSDDTVRGGSSESRFLVEDDKPRVANIFGYLDTKTLGGAGFASQHTADELSLDLSAYDGIQLVLDTRDRKTWTLILKDTLLPTSENGREQASISWEYDFIVCAKRGQKALLISIPWSDFKPTYRGREQKDVKPLNLKDIKQIGFMVRSFFGSQEGSFCKRIHQIRAYKNIDPKPEAAYRYRDEPSFEPRDEDEVLNEKAAWMDGNKSSNRGFFCCF